MTVRPGESISTLMELISASYGTRESHVGECAVDCGGCSKRVSATKSSELGSVPESLVVHVARFDKSGNKVRAV